MDFSFDFPVSELICIEANFFAPSICNLLLFKGGVDDHNNGFLLHVNADYSII